ncbi:hypothetical protein EBR77_01405, partial [bacterium]|nr:hypothetical protein [bacterium]
FRETLSNLSIAIPTPRLVPGKETFINALDEVLLADKVGIISITTFFITEFESFLNVCENINAPL